MKSRLLDSISAISLFCALGTSAAAVAAPQGHTPSVAPNADTAASSMIFGATYFVPVTPCRIADTRNTLGDFGGPALDADASRDFVIPNSACGIPSTATAYSLNVAVVPVGPLGYLTTWPAGEPQPVVVTLNSLDGRIKSNAAIVPAGANGAISVFVTDATDVILDINGYFTATDPAALPFYPVTPCRIADTRNPSGPLGGPSLAGQQTRIFPIPSSSCGVPSNARAYSLNFAVVPSGPLGYLTAWPAGQPQPLVASLNALTGTVTANAAIVPAGDNGAISVFVTDPTDLVIDINGYFAPQTLSGLSLYNLPPCRVKDTRQPQGTPPFIGTLNVNVTASGCGAPVTAAAFVLGATVVPPGPLGYLTMWPQGEARPLAATLNAVDGTITNNMAIVPAAYGSVSAFASDPTQLVLDIFGYFALQSGTASLSSQSLKFADQLVGTTSPLQTVTLTNTGAQPLAISSIVVTGSYPIDFYETNTCGPSLASGASCTIAVTFAPARTGTRTASLTISNAAAVVASIALSGAGVGPNAALSPTSLNFASQVVGTAGSAQPVTLTNNGTLPLSISSIAITGPNAGDFSQTHTCGASLTVGASCTISVTFTPAQGGTRTATLSITDNAWGSPQSIFLSGAGLGPNASLSPTSLTFANQPVGTTSSAQSVTLTNTGTQVLSISSIAVTGPNASDFTETSTCSSSLAVEASCTISVTFTPTQSGTRTASVTISDNAFGSPQSIALSGAAPIPAPIVTLVPSTLSLYAQLGHSSTGVTKLANTGNVTLSITSITITGLNPSDFSQTNDCDSNVAPGAFCTITVTFTPTATGERKADVTISDNAAGSPQQVLLKGNPPPPKIVKSTLAATRAVNAPSPTRPSHVGTRVIHLIDFTRDDPFLANGSKRELLVRFWYPASLTQGCQPAPYTSPAVWSYFSQLAAIPLPEVRTNSCLAAPIADGAHPVVVFTHGHTGTFTDYTFIFEDLASRGYVVASVDHTYEATAVEFPDGRLVKSVLGSHLVEDTSGRNDRASFIDAVSVRLSDLKFVVNELERLNAETGGPFAGKLDMTQVALAGHSLGGLTALAGVEQDAHFKAGIILDSDVPEALVRASETPLLLLSMGREQWSDSECRLWDNLRGPRLAVNLRGAEHVTPSDAVWLAKGAVKTGAMGPEKTVAAVRSYIAAFLDSNLRGKPSGSLLSGPSADYPDAAVTTQEQLLCGEAAAGQR